MENPGKVGRRIAFFGGSFDPPHLGHLAVARAARKALQLDEVLFAPVGAQPLKPEGSSAGFEDRVAMTRLAIAGEAGFRVSLVDEPKHDQAPNYTLEALLRLRDELPQPKQLFFLMGADSFLGLHRWHRAAEIPFVAPLIVASRPGQSILDLGSAMPAGLALDLEPGNNLLHSETLELHAGVVRNPSGETSPFYQLSGVEVDISATQARAWLQRNAANVGETVTEPTIIPAAVWIYIQSHRLYRSNQLQS
jgi:nicotinate-nucleotide adenylyltransferase